MRVFVRECVIECDAKCWWDKFNCILISKYKHKGEIKCMQGVGKHVDLANK